MAESHPQSGFNADAVAALTDAGLDMSLRRDSDAPAPQASGPNPLDRWLPVTDIPTDGVNMLVLRTDRQALEEVISRTEEGDVREFSPEGSRSDIDVVVQGRTDKGAIHQATITSAREILSDRLERSGRAVTPLEVAVRLGDLSLGKLRGVRFGLQTGEGVTPLNTADAEIPTWLRQDKYPVALFDLMPVEPHNAPGTSA